MRAKKQIPQIDWNDVQNYISFVAGDPMEEVGPDNTHHLSLLEGDPFKQADNFRKAAEWLERHAGEDICTSGD